MKIKVKCLNDFDDGTWEFNNGDEYYYDEYNETVLGDNFIPVLCFIADNELIVAAVSGDLTFQAVRD